MKMCHVGLDAHSDSITVALLPPGATVPKVWRISNSSAAVANLAKRLKAVGGDRVLCCYEAGPCGYVLQRALVTRGVDCRVVAPSLIPMKPGDKVKTDRKDATKLAHLLRHGMLTEVHAPGPEDEAVRDLCRAHDDARDDLMRARHRLSKFLLRRGLRYTGGRCSWTPGHRQWLRGLRFEIPPDQATFDSYLLAIEQIEERKTTLASYIEEIARSDRYRVAVEYLCCLKGVASLTALSIVTEVHDIRRFRSARALMAYIGLVPSEYSSGSSVQRGAITRAGNRHLRRLFIEAAWHYRTRPRVTGKVKRRREGKPPQVLAVADRAMTRLNRQYHRLQFSKKPPQKVVTAIARQLVGFAAHMMILAQADTA
jgi:transposase